MPRSLDDFFQQDIINPKRKASATDYTNESTEKPTLHREEAKGAKNLNILAKGIQISGEDNVDAKHDT